MKIKRQGEPARKMSSVPTPFRIDIAGKEYEGELPDDALLNNDGVKMVRRNGVWTTGTRIYSLSMPACCIYLTPIKKGE